MNTKNAIYSISSGTHNPLVFLHGWGFNHSIWHDVFQQLKNTFNVIALDLPGYGNSHYDDSFSFDIASISLELLKVIPDNSIIVGWSLGGVIATYLAAYYPKKISHLILISSSPCFMETSSWPGMPLDVLTGFHQLLMNDFDKTIQRFIHLQCLGAENRSALVKHLMARIANLAKPSEKALVKGLEILATMDLRKEWMNLQCPILSLFGRLDSLVPVAVAKAMNQLNPRTHVVIFQKAAHAAFISDQPLFVKELMTFLGKSYESEV